MFYIILQALKCACLGNCAEGLHDSASLESVTNLKYDIHCLLRLQQIDQFKPPVLNGESEVGLGIPCGMMKE